MIDDMPARPRIYVLLPVHNRRSVTEQFVRNLLTQSYANWHLVLIDDGSTDGTAEAIASLTSSLTILRGDGTWWWGGGLHRGYLWLRSNLPANDDIVLICNDDTEFGPDFLSAAVDAVRPRALLLARQYSVETGEFVEVGVEWDWGELRCRPVADAAQVNCQSTRGLFMQFGVMAEIGGFRPWLMPHYFSDYEYTIRARNLGFALISSPNVSLKYHEDLSGRRTIKPGPLFQVLRTAFSLRCIANPIYWTIFLILCCPGRYLSRNVFLVLLRFAREVRAAVRDGAKASANRASDGG